MLDADYHIIHRRLDEGTNSIGNDHGNLREVFNNGLSILGMMLINQYHQRDYVNELAGNLTADHGH